MLVQWMKRSSSARVHTRSPSFSADYPPQTTPFHPSPSPSPSSIHHKHSVSFKDIESILSLKDIHTLLSDPDPPTRIQTRAWFKTRRPPDSDNKVVVYFTGLRVVRRTYEDCKAVRWILKGYGVKLDERDLSMDGAYVDELVKVVGERREKVVKMLPLVYVNGRRIGGVDEIRRLHESGELKKTLSTVPKLEGWGCGGGAAAAAAAGCKGCGGCRYVVCEYCDGSHKVFGGKSVGWRSCSVCNVNGLVKCPSCTSVLF